MTSTSAAASGSASAPPVRTAVLATDFSPASMGATHAARFVRDALGATVIAVTALEGAAGAADEQRTREWRERVRADAQDYLKDHGLGGVEIETLEGEAAVQVLRIAKERNADLVIIGRRGSHDSTAGVLGTTARRLVRKCPSSVFIARREFSGEIKAVGASTDFSAGAELAAHRAAMLARVCGLDAFEVLHAVEEQAGVCAAYSEEGFVERRAAAARERMAELAPRLQGPGHRLHVESGRTADTIASIARTLHLDVLCMGAHGAGRTPLLLGSTAERVLEVTPCSIWLERSAEEHKTLVERLAAWLS
ncbi:MAG: universal stress protein [Phycisphaerales bacterium]